MTEMRHPFASQVWLLPRLLLLMLLLVAVHGVPTKKPQSFSVQSESPSKQAVVSFRIWDRGQEYTWMAMMKKFSQGWEICKNNLERLGLCIVAINSASPEGILPAVHVPGVYSGNSQGQGDVRLLSNIQAYMDSVL